MLKIVIPDPGLREYSGHHPAMISSLSNSKKLIEGDIELDIFCNENCDEQFIDQTESKNITIKKHFKTNFYQYFYQDLNFSKMKNYIQILTKEYIAVYQSYIEKHECDVLFLFHTLHWEHAIALASASSVFENKHQTRFLHFVYLMFNPVQKNIVHNTKYLNFKMAFRALEKLPNVNCFAGDYELKNNYESFLDSKIEIHPCGLCSSDKVKITESELKNINSDSKYRIILFSGDVKVNKGFLQLPSIVSLLLDEVKLKQIELIIQYTLTNKDPELINVDSEIKALARKDERITLVNEFWSHRELHQNYNAADSIMFNYESKTYKNQSSGVLWLAAKYNLKMFFLTDTWLNREAERLNCQYVMCTESEVPVNIENHILEKASNNRDGNSRIGRVSSNMSYRESLFQDSTAWLYRKYYNT